MRMNRLIDHHLPTYDVRTRHEIEVQASATATYRSIQNLDLGRSIPVAALFAIRGIPHFLTGKARPSRSFTLQTFIDLGFTVLDEAAPREFVMGTVGKFWRPDSGLLRLSSDEFDSFDEPGYAKGIMSFTVDELDSGHSLLATETRVRCTDASSRRKFSMYWRVIAPFSGWIRGVMLTQVKAAAEGQAELEQGSRA